MTDCTLKGLVCMGLAWLVVAIAHEPLLGAEGTPGRAAQGVPKIPTAVFSEDFDGEVPVVRIARRTGISGGNCLDVTIDGRGADRVRPLVLKDRRVLEALRGVWSLTITGWLRTEIVFEQRPHKTIVRCPGRFVLLYHGLYKGRLGLCADGVSQDAQRWAWSSWFTPFLQHDRWVFFAVTVDAVRSKDNVGFYVGSEACEVDLDAIESMPAGPIGPVTSAGLVVGASEGAGESAFDGMLDSVRIYASKDRAVSAALDRSQLEAIRRADLGQAWDRRVAKREADVRDRTTGAGNGEPGPGLRAVQVDVLDRVYPDRWPGRADAAEPTRVPRGGTVGVQFAVRSETDGTCRMDLSPITGPAGVVLAGTARLYELVPVHVEANNNGGARTSVTTKPPGMWMNQFVREAPFDVAEVMVERKALKLIKDRTAALLVDVAVGRDAKPGVYQGALRLRCGGRSADADFSIRVHKTVLPSDGWLSTTYWLSEDPRDLTSGDPPAWWSDDHWRLLENAGRALRAFGQDTMFTPIIDGKQPLIRTIRRQDGSYTFDYRGFDRWVEMFLRLGFKQFDGHHTGGGHKMHMPPMMPEGVFVWDGRTGKRTPLFSKDDPVDDWLAFLGTFYSNLYAHLKEKGWVDRYAQCQLDEPHDYENYKKLASVARKHMPGVKTKDAINSHPERHSPLVDMHVFALSSLASHKALARERRAKGQSVWVYHCCSPYPPYPNRHLDERLSDSRLYPWLAYLLGADGYLYWAANRYRGADPYQTSIGPVPSGSQNPGHPPGDNWFFYPSKDGLLGSLRMVAFRDGLIDHRLVTMLSERDPDLAGRIVKRISRSIVDYQKDPASFHHARKRLLAALDR